MVALSSIEPLETRIAPAALLGSPRLNGPDVIDGEILPAPVTYVWDGSASTDWFTAANWTPDGVPDADDIAILNNSALTINLTGSAAVATFQQSAGTFTGPGLFTVLASFDWSGGTMSGTGTTQVASGATLSISGPGAKMLIQRTLSNEGAATWGQGSIDFSNGATFINKGSFVAQSDSVIRNASANNTFTNDAEGTFTNNTGTTVIEVGFTNAGVLNILSGAVNFNGSFMQSAGSTRVAGNLGTSSTLGFTGGDLTGGGTVTGTVLNLGATVLPGNAGIGILTINGSYTQGAGGTLGVELGGPAPGSQHDQLIVNGSATFDGTLAVTLINGFVPATGTTFNVAVAGTRSGTFSTITGEGLLTPAYTPTLVQLINNATTFFWNGSAGDSNWFTPANWTPAGIPGAANAAVLNLNGSTINLPNSTSVGSFQLQNGTLTTAPNVNLIALEGFTWTGGRMSGAGVTDVPGGILINGGTVVLDGRTLNVPLGQTAILSGTNTILTLQNGARVNNAGTFLVQNDTEIRDGGGAASLFSNSGTFTRGNTTGSFEIGVPLNQNGIVNVLTGTLALPGGSAASSTGDFNVAKRGTLAFQQNFFLAAGADVTGTGTVVFSTGLVTVNGAFSVPIIQISGGTATFNTPVTTTTLTLSNGTLGGIGAVTVNGPLTWSGGTMSGTGTINANGGLAITGFDTLNGRTINLPLGQTATISGPNGVLSMQNGAQFNNAGTFLAQNDNDIRSSGAPSLFTNSGAFTRSSGTGIFDINVPFAHTGTLNIATGTVLLGGGESAPTTGDFNLSTGATLNFQSAFNLGASADVAGAGTVEFSSGAVTIGGSFAVPTVTVSGSTANFNVATSGLQTLNVSGGAANFNAPASGLQLLTSVTVSAGTANFNTSDTLNLTTLTVSGGILNATNTINSSGLLMWTGGTMSGAGITNANGGLAITGFDTLNGRTINLPLGQTATVSSANGLLSMQNGAQFNNAGTFLAQNDNDIRVSGTPSLFTNSGTFTRSAGTGSFEINVPLAHSGTINVATGTLTLGGGESAPTTGDFNVSPGATLNFQSAFNLGASADVAGAGTVEFSSGTVTIGGSFAIPTVTVSGSTANFNVATSGLQTLTVSGGAANFNAPASGLQLLTSVTLSAGTANFNTSDTLNLTTLTVSGGILNATNTINSSGLLTWTGGTISGAGTTNANGGLLITGFNTLDGRTINLPAGQTATLSGVNGLLAMRNGARFNNAGTFLAQNDNDIRTGGGTASLFSNSGTFTRDTGAGLFDFTVPVANTGTIDVQTGSLAFTNGFSQSPNGAILGGRSVNFSGGAVTAGGTITALVSNSGAIFSPGESGAGDLTINGNYTQTSGTFRIELGGVAPGQFDNLTINGTANIAGTLDLVLLSGFVAPTGQQFSVLTYGAHSGVFAPVTGASGFTQDYQATGLVLTKAGVNYVWDAGAGIDDSWFNMLNWAPDGVPIAGDNATLNTNATISLPSTATVQSFTQSNGILIGAGTLTANTFTWSGGTQAGSGTTTVPAGGTFNLNGTGLKMLTQRTLNQGGTGIWTDVGNVQLGNGGVFANSGSFDIQNNAAFQLSAGGSQPLVTNSGTIHKNGGAGITTFTDLRLENSGALRVSVGSLALTGLASSFLQTGGSTTLSGGSLSTVPTLDFSGGTLNGVGTITGNVANNGATVQPGGSLAAGALSITGNYTQASNGILAIDAGGTTPGAQYDQLNVGGTATLGGMLAISYINNYNPSPADVLTIVSAGTRTGIFSQVTGAAPLAANYTPTAVQLIFDNAPPPSISINDVSIPEGASGTVTASFTATLSAPSNQIVTVQFATADGTATAPQDYTAEPVTTLTFNPGEVSKTILVEIEGDTVLEPDETFVVNLSNPTNATIADAQGQGTIINDDIEVVISPDGGDATFIDVDGDEVVVKTTKGEFSEENFVFGADGTLLMIDLTVSGNGPAAAASFGKAKLTVSAKPKAGGNGMVNVGKINALGMGLANIKVDGKLGEIDVGEGVPGERAFKSMKVDSLGGDVFGNAESMIAGTIGTLKVKHDVKGVLNVTGGLSDDALTNTPGSVIGKVIIGGNLDGSAGGVRAGVLRVTGGIDSVVIKGDVLGGADQSGVFVGGSIGTLKIGGDLSSADAAHPVTIAALGTIGATKAKQAVALKKVIVGGDVSQAQILAGYRRDLTPFNPDASIGSIKVAGNWRASSVVAGVADVTFDGFGRNDALIPGDSTPSLLSRIASITIAGSATGSSASTSDFFGVTAQAVGRIQAGSAQGNFNAGPDDVLIDPVNNDFRAVDFA